MKLKATIEVEFEGRTGAHESTLRHALSRGLVGLKSAIERGMSANHSSCGLRKGRAHLGPSEKRETAVGGLLWGRKLSYLVGGRA